MSVVLNGRESFMPVSGPFDGTVGEAVAGGEGWFVAEAIGTDGRPALVLQEGAVADLMRPAEDNVVGMSVLVFGSLQARAAFAAEQGWRTQTARSPRTLLGHLAATRAEVFIQAEVLCTISLAWILSRCDEASRAFGELIGVERSLAWLGEDLFAGVPGRPDLVGRVSPECSPAVIVEAKLGAPLDRRQLLDYLSTGCRLVVLVPQARVAGACRSISEWKLDVGVVSWDQALDAIAAAAVAQPAYEADVAQLADLYRHVELTWVPPFSAIELEPPAARVEDLVKLADQVSADLHLSILRARTISGNMLPMQRSRYRYVSMQPGVATATHVAVGVFDEVGLALAIRWHKMTGEFRAVVDRLEMSGVALQWHGGHVYVPLDVPPDSAHHDMVNALVTQLYGVIDVAEPGLRPLALTSHDARTFIAGVRWQFATTMPQWPHEYTVRGWRPDVEHEFFDVVALIRRDGIVKSWPRDAASPRYNHTYLELDGWEYWTMGEPIADTVVINRARLGQAEVTGEAGPSSLL